MPSDGLSPWSRPNPACGSWRARRKSPFNERSQSSCSCGVQLLPEFRQRQRRPQRQLPASNHLELLHGLPCLALIWVPHSGSPLVKRLITPNSIRVRAESRCFFLRFQLKEGHVPAGVSSRTSVSLDHVVERNRFGNSCYH